MSEFKFRGRCLRTGEWHYGSYLKDYYSFTHCKVVDAIVYTPKDMPEGTRAYRIRVDRETVGQYTSLKDKNCEDIYSGQKLLYRDEFIGTVKRNKYGNYFGHGKDLYIDPENFDKCSIIYGIEEKQKEAK